MSNVRGKNFTGESNPGPPNEFFIIVDRDFRILLPPHSTNLENISPASGTKQSKCYELWKKSAPCTGCPVKRIIDTGEAYAGDISFKGSVWQIKAVPFTDTEENIRYALIYASKTQTNSHCLAGETAAVSELEESKARFLELANSIPAAIFETDLTGKVTFFNRHVSTMFGYPDNVLSDNFQSINFIHPKEKSKAIDYFFKRLQGKLFFRETNEYTVVDAEGRPFHISIRATPIFRSGTPVGVRCICTDISRQKETQQHLEYVRDYDVLTGLFRRSFFEEKLQELDTRDIPVGLISIDVNGLKMINDTLGHEKGDLHLKGAADAIRSCLRKSDIAARTGGDEFAVLLPNTPEITVRKICGQIKKAAFDKNPYRDHGFPLSISTGWAIASSVEEIYGTLKQAEDNMYREKLHQNQSNRSTVIKTLLQTLEARHPVTKDHAEQIERLIRKMGMALNLSDRQIDDLCLFAQFHDIGKVGVSDRILLKPGPLTKKERLEMQKHPEIGHRIALASPDLAPIADWILKHHEWWNGKGYPIGLKGKQIPFESRLLAVIDAYDAMTSPRAYRKTVSHEKAVEELIRCTGTQFDPEVVEIFLRAFPASPDLNAGKL